MIKDQDVCSHHALAQHVGSMEGKTPPLLPVNDITALAQAQTLHVASSPRTKIKQKTELLKGT